MTRLERAFDLLGGWRRVALYAAAATVALVLAIVTFSVKHKVENDPALCTTSCHHEIKQDVDTSHAKGHDGVACQKCHATSIGGGVRLWWQSWTGSKPSPDHGKVAAKTCESCHANEPTEWRPIAATQGHRQHVGAKNVDCLSCHANESHPRGPSAVNATTSCTKCHEDQHLHKATTQGAETCMSCHSFAASAKNAQPPTTVTCEKCHADANALASAAGGAEVRPLREVNEHALHGGVACQLCHNAHGIKQKPPEGKPVCASCHQFEIAQVGNAEAPNAPAGHFKCEGCHKAHQPTGSALQNCIDCHEDKAKGINPSGIGNTTALKHENCASCHQPHTWKAERAGCMTCHEDKANLIVTRSPKGHQSCTGCHDIHGPPPTGSVCLKCHSDTKAQHVALAPGPHKDCTTCHNPHAPRPAEARTACARCHSNELTEVMGKGPEPHAQNSCFTCHQPHNNPMPAQNLCARCHDERALVVAAAGPPKHRVCTSCHQRHVFKIGDIKSTCATCHGPMFDTAAAGFAKIPHDGECRKCHQIHGSPEVAQSSCLGCHEDVKGAFHPPNPKHADCNSCHQPHTPAATAPAKCRGCHQDKAAVAAMWPPQSAHAQQCNQCHQPHDARQKKQCAECHQQEVANGGGGKHQCTQCHAPHQAPPGTGAAWWQRCAQCHADKAASVKARGPTHSECKNCHQQHRFAIPSCSTCHQQRDKLHQVQAHQNCQSCHDPHVASTPSPAQCRRCHNDRPNHEPNAAKCQACHMFR